MVQVGSIIAPWAYEKAKGVQWCSEIKKYRRGKSISYWALCVKTHQRLKIVWLD
jgi:hypothetical protein